MTYEELIAAARDHAEALRRVFPNDGEVRDDARLIARLADALEAAEAERDALITAPLIQRIQQERERADKYQDLTRRTELQCQDAEAALSRAEETIETVKRVVGDQRHSLGGRAAHQLWGAVRRPHRLRQAEGGDR